MSTYIVQYKCTPRRIESSIEADTEADAIHQMTEWIEASGFEGDGPGTYEIRSRGRKVVEP